MLRPWSALALRCAALELPRALRAALLAALPAAGSSPVRRAAEPPAERWSGKPRVRHAAPAPRRPGSGSPARAARGDRESAVNRFSLAPREARERAKIGRASCREGGYISYLA